MEQIAVGLLVFDFNLYPRAEIDPQHVTYIREAIRSAVVTLPPLVVWAKDKRIIDGFHRAKAFIAEFGPEHAVDVILKNYRSEGEAFEDCIRLNANHGRALTRYDRIHSLLRAESLGLTTIQVAKVMGMTVESLGKLRVERVANFHAPGKKVIEQPIKRTISHMAGKRLTSEQIMANGKLSGMNQAFHVNQLITLIESDLLDTENTNLMTRIAVLARLIAKYARQKSAA